MKVLLINTFYYPKFVGGAEVSVQLLAEGLQNQGHSVYVITLGEKDEIKSWNGIIVIRFKERNIFSYYKNEKRNSIQKAIWFILDSCNPFYNHRLKVLLRKINPDVVHTNNVQGFSPYIWRIIKKLKIPLLHTMRDYYLLCHRCSMFDNNSNCQKLCKPCAITHHIKKRFIQYPDLLVGVSNSILEKHSSFDNAFQSKQKKVVYNAVNIPSVVFQKEITGRIVFGFMGRIAEDKGINYLIEQLQIVNKKNPASFSLLLAGKGEENYIQNTKMLLEGIEHTFLGIVSPEQFYERVHVSIVPSLWDEPFGRVAVESLAYGVPVCVSSNGGLKEVYDASCSWLFTPGSIELSDILIDILAHKEDIELKSKQALNHALNFSTERNINGYMQLYQQLKGK